MFTLEIELSLNDSEISGCSMGNLTFIVDSLFITSRGASQKTMMIFISIIELLDMAGRMLSRQSSKEKFVGVDSSFTLFFIRKKTGEIIISSKTLDLKIKNDDQFFSGVLSGVTCFLSKWMEKIPPNDMVVEDLNAALSDYREKLAVQRA